MSYIEFLKLWKVEIAEYPNMNLLNPADHWEIIQGLMLKDKDLIDKSTSAFVSFIWYYKEHNLKFIFQFSLLDIGAVGRSFFLFKLPRVKEILGWKIEGFIQSNVNISNVPYLDKNKHS